MLKHVVWKVYDKNRKCEKGGRIAVRVGYDNYLMIRRLAGKALPSRLLLKVLNIALPAGWKSEAEELHQGRKNPWYVEKHVGVSGKIDVCLRILKSAEWEDRPLVAGIHISMYGKLNEGLSLWLGDLLPLMAANIENFVTGKEDEFNILEIKEVYIPDSIPFISPGESSHFQAILGETWDREVNKKEAIN